MSAELPEYFSKLVHAFSGNHPRGRAQCTARKPFAAASGVSKQDSISDGIKTDFVSAWMCACSIGGEINGSRVACCADFLGKLLERAGRGIFLGGMMNLPTPGIVVGMFCKERGCLRHCLQENVHADGKIRAPD